MHLSWRTHCETGSVSHAHSRARAERIRQRCSAREMRLAWTMQLHARVWISICVCVHRRVGTGPTRGPEARSNSRTVDTDLTQRPAAVHTPSSPSAPPVPLGPPFLSLYTACQKSGGRKRSDDGERRCEPKSLLGGHLAGVDRPWFLGISIGFLFHTAHYV